MTSSPPPLRRLLPAAGLLCAAALAAGCGSSGSPAAAPTKTITVRATPAAPATSPAASPVPATGPASPTAAGGPACATRSLRVKLGLAQGAAGSTFQVIDFTNISNATCTLYGYPGVSLAGGKPVTQIGPAAAESHTTARTPVTLAPGAVANAVLRIAHAVNFPAAKCHLVTADHLRIYPPNQTTRVSLPYTSQTCAKPVQILTIGVVQAGSGGQ
jgi:Protein of unknown function (DUF4232)